MAMTYFRLPKFETSKRQTGRQVAASRHNTRHAASKISTTSGADLDGIEALAAPMPAASIAFTTAIKTKGNSLLPASLATVSEAVEAIHGLPFEKQNLQRWRRVLESLARAQSKPDRPAMTDVAATELRAALLAEGWLH
jgi:hypothetical protein